MTIHAILSRASNAHVAIKIMLRQGFTQTGEWYTREFDGKVERLTRAHVTRLYNVYAKIRGGK